MNFQEILNEAIYLQERMTDAKTVLNRHVVEVRQCFREFVAAREKGDKKEEEKLLNELADLLN